MTPLLRPAALAFAVGLVASSGADAQNPPGVSALGFVEPEGGVIHLIGPVSVDGSAVSELTVKEGDWVEAGQVIAVLDNHERYQAALRKAEAQVAVREAMLNQVLAGAREGQVGAQQEAINRIAEQLNQAKSECERYRTLLRQNVVPRVTVDEKCSEADVRRRELAEARANLADISDVRAVDVAINQAELAEAEAAVRQAEVDVDRTMVRAPVEGQILKSHAKPGELIGDKGVVDLGQTKRMWISAEVYETDIVRVQVGQTALVTSDGFVGELRGTVEEIGLIIGKNDIVEPDPTADVDARVVEVKIKLREEDSDTVARLTNLQVSVVIQTDGA